LPSPDGAAAAHSDRLRGRISEEIRAAGGAIPFSRYVELALYAPGLGYYSAGTAKFGEAGDFVTAPECGPLFARCLARYCEDVLAGLGGGEILELGGGSGALAADLLAGLAARDALPERYRILELSADLRARQRSRIAGLDPDLARRVEWLDALPAEPLRGVIFGNEVLDALPFERIRIGPDGPVRLGVGEAGGRFVWSDLPMSDELSARLAAVESDLGGPLATGYETELCPALDPWLAAVAEPLECGVVLFVDYGLPRSAYYHPERHRGTLRCHYRHRAHDDPFLWPGLQDVTAWVDYTAVADAGLAAGLELVGFTTQAAFLLECGAAELAGPDDAAAARRLLLPGEMGEGFKAIGLGRDVSGPFPGLTLSDLSGSL
jgi:SAM-dependent MidA family methyltransferase